MKIKSLPMGLLAEVLDYLADYEHLSGLDHILDEEFTVIDVRSALREMAVFIRTDIEQKKASVGHKIDIKGDERLSAHVKDLLSALSPTDEKKLLDRFGFLDS